MKKNVIKRLQAVAAELPALPERKPNFISGEELIEQKKREGKVLEDDYGHKIDPKVTYKGFKDGTVNHVERLKDAYKRGGDNAVSAYAGSVVRKHSELMKKAKALQDAAEEKKLQPQPELVA